MFLADRFAINEQRNRARTAVKFHYEISGTIKYKLRAEVKFYPKRRGNDKISPKEARRR